MLSKKIIRTEPSYCSPLNGFESPRVKRGNKVVGILEMRQINEKKKTTTTTTTTTIPTKDEWMHTWDNNNSNESFIRRRVETRLMCRVVTSSPRRLARESHQVGTVARPFSILVQEIIFDYVVVRFCVCAHRRRLRTPVPCPPKAPKK